MTVQVQLVQSREVDDRGAEKWCDEPNLTAVVKKASFDGAGPNAVMDALTNTIREQLLTGIFRLYMGGNIYVFNATRKDIPTIETTRTLMKD